MAVDNAGGGSGSVPLNRFRRLREPLTSEQQNQKLKDVSKLYEKQFLGEMLKAMRSTVSESGFVQANQAEKIFREQLDQQYVEKWGDNGGIGLSNVIYDQLLQRLGPSLGIRLPEERPHGPLKLDAKSTLQNSAPGKMTVQYDVDLKSAALDEGPHEREVTMPWAGNVLGVQKLDFDEYFLNMQHDNGMKSQMTFRGKLSDRLLQGLPKSPGPAGLQLQSGEKLGVLSPEAKQVFWSVSGKAEQVGE